MQQSDHRTAADAAAMMETFQGMGIACKQRDKRVIATFRASDLSKIMGVASAAAVRAGAETVLQRDRVGRNDPCPCNSGKKYKRCCLDER